MKKQVEDSPDEEKQKRFLPPSGEKSPCLTDIVNKKKQHGRWSSQKSMVWRVIKDMKPRHKVQRVSPYFPSKHWHKDKDYVVEAFEKSGD